MLGGMVAYTTRRPRCDRHGIGFPPAQARHAAAPRHAGNPL